MSTFYPNQMQGQQGGDPRPKPKTPFENGFANALARGGQAGALAYQQKFAGPQSTPQRPEQATGQFSSTPPASEAMGNLGIAGQNAMGQYGMNRDHQLTNQAIANANAMGQQSNSLLNLYGSLGQSMAGMAGAAGQAGADTNKAAALGGLGAGMVNAGMYGSQMGPYTAGNMPNFNMGFGGFGGGGGMGPGFHAGGPEGTIASGNQGLTMAPPGPGGGGGTTGRPFNTPPPPPYMPPGGGGGFVNPYDPFNQGAGFLSSLLKESSGPKSSTNTAMKNTTDQFNAAREAVMDPSIIDSLNNQMEMGYGALGGLSKPGQRRRVL